MMVLGYHQVYWYLLGFFISLGSVGSYTSNYVPFSLCLGKFFLIDAGYAVRPRFLPPYRGTRHHLREFGVRSPQNPRKLFNLRHSSLRVTVERAFGALKNRFKILYKKPFHPYKTQVKLVLACCILHNWILRYGVDEVIPLGFDWEANPTNEVAPNDNVSDNNTWASKRDTRANQMWQTRNGVH